MKYQELERIFRSHEADCPKYHLDGLITFTELCPRKNSSYTQRDLTYIVSSDNKAYRPNSLDYFVFGTCLNGKAISVQLANHLCGLSDWTSGECCLIHYQLQCIHGREVQQPEVYPTYRQAAEAMLRALSVHGSLEYSAVLTEFQNNRGQISDTYFEATTVFAWLNAGTAGDWCWVIQPIYVFDVANIAVGDLFPDGNADTASAQTEPFGQDGGD